MSRPHNTKHKPGLCVRGFGNAGGNRECRLKEAIPMARGVAAQL